MKLIYTLPILAVILLLCTAGCISTVTPNGEQTPTQTTVQTPSPDNPSEKLIGTWKLSEPKTPDGSTAIISYTITFNPDGTCAETDYWSDGDASHWAGNWKKTGDNTYTYNAYPLFTVQNGVLHTWYDSVNLYGSETFIGKWVQKEEDKSLVYFEYIFNKDGTGTQIRKADMNGETQSMNVPLVWKDLGGEKYQVIINNETTDYQIQLISDTTIFEPELNEYLTKQ